MKRDVETLTISAEIQYYYNIILCVTRTLGRVFTLTSKCSKTPGMPVNIV